MRHQSRLLDQALDPSQAFREREELAAFEHFARVLDIPAQHSRDDATITTLHLMFGEFVLRMARKPGVIHPRDLRMTLQELRHRLSVRAVTLHAQGKCLNTAQREKGVERT